ncbi:unnamed protein product [Nezara viridula]|uniref:Uncharacterized protein n=1 Tax=Nezara viridula TaxID=85310 RepID=A0A9P0E985_NEZVI|nr:unnamed protein product [Nezara viridula]
MEKIRNHHSSKDIDRVLKSKSNPRYRKICSFNVTRPEDYLQFRALNLNKLRAVSRLRVAGSEVTRLGSLLGLTLLTAAPLIPLVHPSSVLQSMNTLHYPRHNGGPGYGSGLNKTKMEAVWR